MYLEIYSMLVFTLIFLLGLSLGSYLNSWMWRVSEGKYVFMGRSICIHCSRELAWYENIPLFSFIFLRGKCRTCQKPIPMSYFFVELGTGLLFLAVSLLDSQVGVPAFRLFRDLLFVSILVVVFVYDLKYQLVLTGLIWLGLLAGLIINIRYLRMDPYDLGIAAAVGGGFFLLQYILTKGKGIGGGDVRLGAMMGAWLGLSGVLVALFVSYMLGAAVGITLIILRKKKGSSAIPFGTFLSVGTFAAMFWGERIARWYLGLMGR